MSKLVVFAYPSDSVAPAVVDKLERLSHELEVDLEDMVYVTCNAKGDRKLHHPLSQTGKTATVGGMCGLLAGVLLLNPVAGAAIGAGAGAIASKLSDAGIKDDFVRELSDQLGPGTSAVFVLVRSVNAERVVPELAHFGGRVMHSDLAPDAEQRLREIIEAGRGAAAST